MTISLNKLGKKFNRDWIFKNLDFDFEAEKPCAILGSNGSGKSTLLQIISGAQLPVEGEINYSLNDTAISYRTFEELYKNISIAAPYMELIEEYTLEESVKFHSQFKSFMNGLTDADVIEITGLAASRNKQLKYFSSGMKQRVRLALAVLSDTKILLLDEPCSNLDQKAVDWYNELIQKYSKGRIIIVCSNHQENEYKFCTATLNINDFKPASVQNN